MDGHAQNIKTGSKTLKPVVTDPNVFLSCHKKYILQQKQIIFIVVYYEIFPELYIYIYILKVISIIKFRHMSNF